MLAMGIDVGGTNIRFGVFENGNLVYTTRTEANLSQHCQAASAEAAALEVVGILLAEIVNVIEKYPNIQAVGIGFPGFIHPDSKKIIQSPNLPGLSYFDLRSDLMKILDLPVIIENDANAAAYGEYCLLGKPKTGLIYFGLGTGVGGGLIHACKPFAGFHGCAMEVGHIIVEPNGRLCGCGNQGCMEQYASASGVTLSYASQKLTAQQIAELARKGDTEAQAAYNKAGEALAAALAHVLKVVDVPNVVIGGGVSGAWDLMQVAFDAILNADLIPVLRGKIKVTISTSGDQAGMLGAALLASH